MNGKNKKQKGAIRVKSETIIGLIAIIALVAVAMCTGYAETTSATSESEPALAPGYKWYHDDEFNFKIGYPESWTVTPTEEKNHIYWVV